MNYESDMNN